LEKASDDLVFHSSTTTEPQPLSRNRCAGLSRRCQGFSIKPFLKRFAIKPFLKRFAIKPFLKRFAGKPILKRVDFKYPAGKSGICEKK
jgi:hypothetical protein